ncbi:hypothetical protein CFC21_042776 [Triticum aestivum]|uniref:KIB1-4 beta-propeller domain-containing protein n=2 Tax=Triticum aestivum TaxID=4565 RepID=A0A9R1FN02_WHEAT|nr:hypothetical protein CFC21_042776 [Triticum aestivum]
MVTSTPAPWSELPQDVLDLIIDRLVSSPPRGGFFSSAWSLVQGLLGSSAKPADFKKVRRVRHWVSADRARFRAVCRSWHLAMRRRLSASRQLPWIVMSDGSFYTPSDAICTSPPRLPTLPSNTRCIGSTDDWLALDFINAKKMHSYSLHNPFTGITVSLPQLDAVIGQVCELFEVRKVLMRSTPSDIVAVMTNNWNHPLILIRPGKGLWLPEPQSAPFVDIVDIAFLGDKLYGITEAEDLVSLGIEFNSDGMPTVSSTECLIRHPSGNSSRGVWREFDDNFYSSNNDKGGKDEVTNSFEDHTEAVSEDSEERALDELRNKTGDGMILEGATWWLDDEVPHEPKDIITVIRYLIESHGKLLMVKRKLHWPQYSINFTSKVEVYEMDVNDEVHWVPVSGGLGSKALFISRFFCKSIHTCEDGDRDALHFIDSGEKYDMRSQIVSPSWRDIDLYRSTWIFSRELVV